MNKKNKDIEKYLKEIKKSLICSAVQKKIVINDLRNSIYDYVDEAKTTDINEIYSHFGQPKDIAEQFISETNGKYLKITFNVKKILIAVVIALFATVVIFLTIDFIDSLNSNPTRVVETLAEEIDEEIVDGQVEIIEYNEDGSVKKHTTYQQQ